MTMGSRCKFDLLEQQCAFYTCMASQLFILLPSKARPLLWEESGCCRGSPQLQLLLTCMQARTATCELLVQQPLADSDVL